jgi:peroxiredoxin Q/BCP
MGQHWIDPTRDVPPLSEVYEGVTDALGLENPETFGF